MANSTEPDSVSSELSDAPNAHGFYNNVQERGLKHRNQSKIYYMRNFNNWIKSTLIDEYLKRIREEQPDRRDKIHVFDMGCGKGGDQSKWQIGEVNSVTFSDLAENSIEDCRQRYRERKCKYEANFFPLNCCTELIRDELKTSEPCFDLVSTQFVIHYSFEKMESANRFLRNAAEFLRVGGYFIGTTVNSCELVNRCRETSDQSISNDVFKINFDPSIDLSQTTNESIPLFGTKYDFVLDDVVNCPEYLVYFPLLEKLAKKHGLERVDRQTFKEYFEKNKGSDQGYSLFATMKALEYYELPTDNQGRQRGPSLDPNQYTHAEKHINDSNQDGLNSIRCCRTLSKQDWDITSLYIIFAFKKVHNVKYNEDINVQN